MGKLTAQAKQLRCPRGQRAEGRRGLVLVGVAVKAYQGSHKGHERTMRV